MTLNQPLRDMSASCTLLVCIIAHFGFWGLFCRVLLRILCDRALLHGTPPGQMNLVFARGRRRRTLRVLPGVIHGLNGRDLLRPDSSHIELPRLIPAILVTTCSACTL